MQQKQAGTESRLGKAAIFSMGLLLVFLCPAFMSGAVQAQELLKVSSYYGSYSTEGKQPGPPSPSLEGPVVEQWRYPEPPEKPLRFAVLFPHHKDPYWVSVNYGVMSEARRLGISIDLYDAGGYSNISEQVRQLKTLLKEGNVDGVIIGAVKYRKMILLEIYKKFQAKNIPLVALVNDTYSPAIKAKSLLSQYWMGYHAGEYLADYTEGKNITVVVSPGPQDTGWSMDTLKGFIDSLKKKDAMKRMQILPPIWEDTGYYAQRPKIEAILKRKKNLDYFVGNAPAVMALVSKGTKGETPLVDQYRNRHPNLKVISTYMVPPIYELIKEGKVLAAPTDFMKYQGVMSVDMMVRILNGEQPGDKTAGFPFRATPLVRTIHAGNLLEWNYEKLFGEKGYKPIFHLEGRK